MALKGVLTWLCSFAVLSSSITQHETLPNNCGSQDAAQLVKNLSADLQVVAECGESILSVWSAEQRAALLLSMKNLTDSMYKYQLNECNGAEPNNCPTAEVPSNGGLACVTVASKRYCKPMCNHGYDFGFIRKSRLFEECSKETQYKWSSQYIGGNKLAVCDEASLQVAGAKSAYFPKDQDCLTTKSNSQLLNKTIEIFTTELEKQGIQEQPQFACLLCG